MTEHNEQDQITTFHGRFEHSLNPQGRTSLPKVFRDQLVAMNVDHLWVTNEIIHDLDCLIAYTPKGWNEHLANIHKTLSPMDPNYEDVVGYSISGAQQISYDENGRILLPADLRAMAGLNKDIMFVGAVKRIEIWDVEKWARRIEIGKRNYLNSKRAFADAWKRDAS